MPITVTQGGDWDAFEQEVAAFARLEGATVGTTVPETPHPGVRARKSNLSYRDLVEINEYGTDATKVPIPARPIFGPAMTDNEDHYVKLLDGALRAFRRSGGSEAALRAEMAALGQIMVQDVHDKWAEQDFQPLADSTIARKGGNDIAWEETGQLLDSIGFAVNVDMKPAKRFSNGRAAFRDVAGRFAKAGS